MMREDQFSWTDKPVIGIVLMNAQHDSHGNKIDPMKYYNVGKHIKTGMLAIIETTGNMKDEFVNSVWKKSGKLN